MWVFCLRKFTIPSAWTMPQVLALPVIRVKDVPSVASLRHSWAYHWDALYRWGWRFPQIYLHLFELVRRSLGHVVLPVVVAATVNYLVLCIADSRVEQHFQGFVISAIMSSVVSQMFYSSDLLIRIFESFSTFLPAPGSSCQSRVGAFPN